jgi:hypothetical protein
MITKGPKMLKRAEDVSDAEADAAMYRAALSTAIAELDRIDAARLADPMGVTSWTRARRAYLCKAVDALRVLVNGAQR